MSVERSKKRKRSSFENDSTHPEEYGHMFRARGISPQTTSFGKSSLEPSHMPIQIHTGATDGMVLIPVPKQYYQDVVAFISDLGGGRKKREKGRAKFSDKHLQILEAAFKETQYPNPEQRNALAKALGHDIQKINTWFQNRRAKDKDKKKEEEE